MMSVVVRSFLYDWDYLHRTVYAVLVGSSLYLEVKVVFFFSRNYRGIPAKGVRADT